MIRSASRVAAPGCYPTAAILALAPELVGLLRAYLAMDDEARRENDDPATPESLVFGMMPSRLSFTRDRDQAGVPAVDSRGRPLSLHSARKWFATEMTRAGVAEKLVDKLMRHAGRPEHRYYDPPLDDQAEALARLPRLWPSAAGVVDNFVRGRKNLTGGGERADTVGEVEPASSKGQVGSPASSRAEMPSSVLESDGELNDVAALLELVARLIRSRCHGPGPRAPRDPRTR